MPTLGLFAYRPAAGGPDVAIPFGASGISQTIPAPGDYDGDGQTDVAAYLPEFDAFADRPSSGGPDVFEDFGIAGDGQTLPVSTLTPAILDATTTTTTTTTSVSTESLGLVPMTIDDLDALTKPKKAMSST